MGLIIFFFRMLFVDKVIIFMLIFFIVVFFIFLFLLEVIILAIVYFVFMFLIVFYKIDGKNYLINFKINKLSLLIDFFLVFFFL